MTDKQIAESPFGIHEALHTCSVLMDTFGLRVAEHPAVALRPAILAKAEDAIERMMDVYQALGALPEWHKDITPPNGDEVREALERVRNGLRAYLPNSHVSTPVSIQRLVEICDAALAKEKLGRTP